MKLKTIIRSVALCAIVSMAAISVVSCEGRAKIADVQSPHNGDNHTTEPQIALQVVSVSSSWIELQFDILNYYSLSSSKFDLEEGGVFYRKSSESQSQEKVIYFQINGPTAFFRINSLSWGTQYTMTPFVINDYEPNVALTGTPITARTN